ncbi:uncharacterized protein LOC117119033 [Anneissia japonica]|uniref:uncharacterized protein LOC117119033 n=1 Tax=Anneissia japonica TaxID=1529436 RepID=UPI00142595BE|nr:uncharacterized protein LOC117119033 [Anneissia japonica]
MPSNSSDGRQVVKELSPNDWIAVQAGDRIGIYIKYGYILCDESGLDAVRFLYLYNNNWVRKGDEFAFSAWYTRAYSFAAIMDTGCPDLSWTYYNKWCFRSSNVNSQQGGSDDCYNTGAMLMPRFTELVFLEKLISNNTPVWTDEIHVLGDGSSSSTSLCTSVSLTENAAVFQNVSCDKYLLVVCAIYLKEDKGDV